MLRSTCSHVLLPREIAVRVMCVTDYRAAEALACTCKDFALFTEDFWHAYISSRLGVNTRALQRMIAANRTKSPALYPSDNVFIRTLQIVGRGEWDAPLEYDALAIEIIVHGYDMKQRVLVDEFLRDGRIVWHKTITTRNTPGGIPNFPWFARLREYYNTPPLAAHSGDKRIIAYPLIQEERDSYAQVDFCTVL